jgi:hypothetical protein
MCGSVDVFHAGRKLGRVSPHSATTVHRQVRWLPSQSAARTGTVVIRTSSSKRVDLDGIAVRH